MATIDGLAELLGQFTGSGYAVIDLLTEEQHETLERICRDRIKELAQQVVPGAQIELGPLDEYHQALIVSEEVHQRLMARDTRYVTFDTGQQRMLVNEIVFPFLERHWGHHNVRIKHALESRLVDGLAGFRFVRPGSQDATGIHSETGQYLTLWIPIVGFDERSTLKLSPGSQLNNHPAEAITPDSRSAEAIALGPHGYTPRQYSDDYTASFDFIRPNMQKGQAILFHPNLLHRGSDNSSDRTRVSVELRLHELGDRG